MCFIIDNKNGFVKRNLSVEQLKYLEIVFLIVLNLNVLIRLNNMYFVLRSFVNCILKNVYIRNFCNF